MKTCLKTRADVDYDEDSDEDEDNGNEYKDSMKTLTKNRRTKTEEEKKEKWLNMSKIKKLMKIIARGDFEYREMMMNIMTTPMSMKTDE